MDVQPYRRPPSFLAPALLVLLAAPAVGQTTPASSIRRAEIAHLAASTAGSIRLLTYNIAGLPEGISRSRPERNVPRIGPLFEPYDLVLVQEDFVYQAQLRSGVAQ